MTIIAERNRSLHGRTRQAFTLEMVSGPFRQEADLPADQAISLIGAERTGRVGRGVEIDPRYVDLIARRCEEVTGTAAVLEDKGEPFAVLAARRRGEADAAIADTARTIAAPATGSVIAAPCSAMVRSGTASSAAPINPAWASVRRDSRAQPCGLVE